MMVILRKAGLRDTSHTGATAVRMDGNQAGSPQPLR
jgi:hypothetical protein